jgi:hypothetical protein
MRQVVVPWARSENGVLAQMSTGGASDAVG